MSALPPKADIVEHSAMSAKCHIPEDSEVIDLLGPVREDFLTGTPHLRGYTALRLDYPLARRSSISLATSSQVSASSRSSCLTKVSSAVLANSRYFSAWPRK